MKLYLAGPMSGLPEHNFPAFRDAAARWRAKGWEVANPADLSADVAGTDDHEALARLPWADYLRADLRAMLDCHGIVLLAGWQHSRGARLERQVAEALGMLILEDDE